MPTGQRLNAVPVLFLPLGNVTHIDSVLARFFRHSAVAWSRTTPSTETFVSLKRLIDLCAAVTYLVNIDVYCGFLCRCENYWSAARYARHDGRIASLIILEILTLPVNESGRIRI